MQSIEDLLREQRTFGGLSDFHLSLVAGCGKNQVFKAGEYLMRERESADSFYVIREGRVALEIFAPERGALVIETLRPGELLGWSWLVPPYVSHLDARATEETRAIAFDAACLRGKSDEDPALGYELLRRFVPVMVERLQATRVQLLDVYGIKDG